MMKDENTGMIEILPGCNGVGSWNMGIELPKRLMPNTGFAFPSKTWIFYDQDFVGYTGDDASEHLFYAQVFRSMAKKLVSWAMILEKIANTCPECGQKGNLMKINRRR